MMAHQVSSSEASTSISEASTSISEASTSMSEDDYDDLWEIPFVQIPNVPYVLKFKYGIAHEYYMILITNLRETYSEKLTETEVHERFKILNPHVEMKPDLIIWYIKNSLQSFLDQKTSLDSKLIQESFPPQAITLHLEFKSKVILSFDIKPQLLPNERLRTHIIAPIVISSNIISREIGRLRKHIFEEKPVQKMYDSRLNKKSKITEEDLLDAFLKFQETIQDCIRWSKNCKDEYNSDVQTVSPKRKYVINFGPRIYEGYGTQSTTQSTAQNTEKPSIFDSDFDFLDMEGYGSFCSDILISCKKDSSAPDLLKDYKLDVKRENIKKNYIGKKIKPLPKDTGEKPSSNEPQSSEISAISVEREIEGSPKSETDSSSKTKNENKLQPKKKRCIKF